MLQKGRNRAFKTYRITAGLGDIRLMVSTLAANRSRSWEAENFKKMGRLGIPSLLIRAIKIYIFIKAVQKYIFPGLFTNKKSNNLKLLLQIFLFTSMNLYLVNKNNKFLINFKKKGKFLLP